MTPLVKSLFCQGLKELVTEEDFEGVLPVFEFQKKRIDQDPQRTITAVEIFPFRRVPAPVKFVILAAREPTQLDALQRLWEEAYSERTEGMENDPPDTGNRLATHTRHKADPQEKSLTDRLSREVERLKTLKQCAAAGRLVALIRKAIEFIIDTLSAAHVAMSDSLDFGNSLSIQIQSNGIGIPARSVSETISIESDIVKSKFGYHIIKLTGREEPKQLALDEVRDRIIRQLQSQSRRDVRQTLAKQLRENSTIEVFDELLPGEPVEPAEKTPPAPPMPPLEP